MRTKGSDRGGASRIAATAKAFGTAIASLALGVALCLCLLLGGTALAGGAATPTHDRGDHPALLATAPSEHSLESVSVVLEKMTERAAERRIEEPLSVRIMDARRADLCVTSQRRSRPVEKGR
jgi:hypothetical protein